MSNPRYLHVLLVEDHRDSAASLAALLRDLGHAVTVAGSVSGALAAARDARRHSQDLDLALVDLCLPDGDGATLMPELARMGLRGISMSARGKSAEIGERSARAGFEAHLVKPFPAAALQRLLVREADAA